MFRTLYRLGLVSALLLVVAGCAGGGDIGAGEGAVERAKLSLEPTPAPPLPGSSMLSGMFEYRAEHAGRLVWRGLYFDGERATRFVDGQATATEAYSVVQDGPGRVVVELVAADGEVRRREFVFSGADVLADAVVPEVEYRRSPSPVGLEGSGSWASYD